MNNEVDTADELRPQDLIVKDIHTSLNTLEKLYGTENEECNKIMERLKGVLVGCELRLIGNHAWITHYGKSSVVDRPTESSVWYGLGVPSEK
jgi:hypothetical protein